MIRDNLVFLREFLAEFEATGSFFPTSKRAAEELTRPLQNTSPPRKILEIGPGTGSVTQKIIADMRDQDELVICEINPRFMQSLKLKLALSRDFLRHRDRIKFFQGPIQSFPEGHHFDVVVCALPFLNFDRKMVEEIFQNLRELSHPETVMTYYEYIGLKSLGKFVSPKERKRRLLDVENFFDTKFSSRHIGRRRVWLNILPISVYTIRLAA